MCSWLLLLQLPPVTDDLANFARTIFDLFGNLINNNLIDTSRLPGRAHPLVHAVAYFDASHELNFQAIAVLSMQNEASETRYESHQCEKGTQKVHFVESWLQGRTSMRIGV